MARFSSSGRVASREGGDDALARLAFGVAEGFYELDARCVLDEFGAEKHSGAGLGPTVRKARAGASNQALQMKISKMPLLIINELQFFRPPKNRKNSWKWHKPPESNR
jgi:hypothetical protein